MKRLAGIFQLSLFLFYFFSTGFFLHTHVVDGVAIIHSHLFQQNAEKKGTAAHEHSQAELLLIQILDHWNSEPSSNNGAFESSCISANEPVSAVPDFQPSTNKHSTCLQRGPPAGFSS